MASTESLNGAFNSKRKFRLLSPAPMWRDAGTRFDSPGCISAHVALHFIPQLSPAALLAWHYNTTSLDVKLHVARNLTLTCNSLHNMLWRTCPPSLLPLQGCLLLRPQLPKVRLEDPPQRLRTHYPDLLRTRHTQLLQPHQPHERVLRMRLHG